MNYQMQQMSILSNNPQTRVTQQHQMYKQQFNVGNQQSNALNQQSNVFMPNQGFPYTTNFNSNLQKNQMGSLPNANQSLYSQSNFGGQPSFAGNVGVSMPNNHTMFTNNQNSFITPEMNGGLMGGISQQNMFLNNTDTSMSGASNVGNGGWFSQQNVINSNINKGHTMNNQLWS